MLCSQLPTILQVGVAIFKKVSKILFPSDHGYTMVNSSDVGSILKGGQDKEWYTITMHKEHFWFLRGHHCIVCEKCGVAMVFLMLFKKQYDN